MGPHDKPSVPEHINTEEGDIDTEWESRRSRFYNVGYKEGLDEGKAATMQEGFDAGYRSGTATGYQQGLEKGKQATLSAFAQLKGKMGAS